MIDDPVQAMDPAKVDGLARVLHRAARTRQIVVFTHDDRLPEAIRRLRLDATMLHVDRRARSAVDVQVSRSPIQRYLDGARGYAKPDRAAARGPGARRADVLPQRGRGRRGQHRPPPGGRARHVAWTRPTSRSTRRARCARRSRSACSARPAARARSATRSASATARPPPRLVTELNRGAHGAMLDPSTLKRLPDEHARVHPRADGDDQRLTVAAVLDEAERHLDEFDPQTSGAWPHAAAVLIRQSLESTLNVFWGRTQPGMLEASCARPLVVPAGLPRRPAGGARGGLRLDARCRRPATTAPTRSA